jgi:hypothetical protein
MDGYWRVATLIGWVYRWRSLWSAALFLAYLQWLHPVLLRKELFLTAYGSSDVLLGLFLVVAQGLDFVGAQIKYSCLMQRSGPRSTPPFSGLLLLGFTSLFRFFYDFILLMTIGIVFGYDIRQDQGWGLFFTLFLAMILKEGLMLGPVYEPIGGRPFVSGWRWLTGRLERVLQRQPLGWLLEMTAEVLLLLAAATGFTSTWDYLVATIPPIDPNQRAFGYLGAGLIFCMLYLASQFVFLIEENLFVLRPWQRWLRRGVFLAALLICVGAVPVGAG